ncbi:MAG: nucleotidyltransferase family protein [Candidatus Omnitrophica bacterium]|nr:nucleotidyltransferase family protein [Candidatus Omnitrophota bacterium]
MIALILAAGYGTRLYPLAEKTPKALLPVKGKPILDYLMEKICRPSFGTKEIVLVSNRKYVGEFEKWAAGQKFPVPVKILDDGSTSEVNRLGSIGDILFALRRHVPFAREDTLVLGSDNLLEDDLSGFVSFARRHTPHVTLGAYELPDPALASRYGVMKTDAQDRILELQEKPAQPVSKLVSTAVYFFPSGQLRQVLEYDGSADTLGSFIRWLVSREPVFAYRVKGSWFDIGDMASYEHAQKVFTP